MTFEKLCQEISKLLDQYERENSDQLWEWNRERFEKLSDEMELRKIKVKDD